jgi:uncharacterized protein DUF2784
MAGLLADVTVVVHLIVLAYIGLGGFLAWRWPRTIFVHVFFAVWGVAINTLPLECPLTVVEDYFRARQGLGPLPGGFNEYYIYDDLVPRSLLPVVAAVGITALVVSYVGVWVRWRRNQLTTAR